jgi:hypothetical protein
MAIERPYNCIAAREVPAHGDLAANSKLVDEILMATRPLS